MTRPIVEGLVRPHRSSGPSSISGEIRSTTLGSRGGMQDIEEISAPRNSETNANDSPAPIIENIGDGHFFIGHSRSMREIRALAGLIAHTSVPVLILGETGSGKEAVVRLIHFLSSRRSRPLLKVNCAALPAELLESELFGYEAGAFTGASKRQIGKFEACHDGTILLDEIAEMPAGPQAKLLHVLQDGEFHRLGDHTPIRINVRVLAATNVDIHRALKNGKFREDLYYRLNAFSIHVPPLRERAADIPVLIQHLIKHLSQRMGCTPMAVSPELTSACLRYSWPGNLRELENFIKRHLIIRDEQRAIGQLEPNRNRTSPHTESVSGSFAVHATNLKSLVRDLKRQAEQQAILAALQLNGGRRKEAARQLNISTRALLYKMREYGIAVGKDAAEEAPVATPRSAKRMTVGSTDS
jgi:two-component system, NtrC family, response regulator AtoC